jgi:hypothetical protein
MVIFAILLVIAIVAAFIALVCGAGIFAVFGDLIVFGLIVWALVKLFRRKKK